MSIKYNIQVEDGLEKALKEILKNPRNSFDIQGVLTISHDITPKGSFITSFGKTEKDNSSIVDLYLNDKYAEFKGEFTQTAPTNPELKPLVDYLTQNGWANNLD